MSAKDREINGLEHSEKATRKGIDEDGRAKGEERKKKNGSLSRSLTISNLTISKLKKKTNQALTRWGGALLELAHFCHGAEAYEKISTAVSKFDEALAIDPKKHDALWCLGNAYTSQGFLTADSGAAAALFKRAAGCFERALAEDPGSEVYRKALEMTSKAPELHEELQKQLHASQVGGGGGTSSSGGGGGGGVGGGGQQAKSEFWWDVAGWVALSAVVVGVVALSRGGPTPK